jgi:hypothetical protein
MDSKTYLNHQELFDLFELDDSKFYKVQIAKQTKQATDTSETNLRKRKAVVLGNTYELRPRKLHPGIYTNTPGRVILHGLSPESRKHMIKDFKTDDKRIHEMYQEQEKLDNEYTYFEYPEVGNHMELWVCTHMKCPGCKTGELLKYRSMSQPVVDVKCSNPIHDIYKHGPKYYQIKATQKGTNMNGKQYFSLNEKYIKVGSKRFGKNAHEIKVSDNENKRVLIGYICIEYTKTEGSRIITIVNSTSFILIPNLSYKLKVGDVDKFYYEYIDQGDTFPTVTFYKEFFRIITFGELGITSKVNLDDNYDLLDYDLLDYDPLQKKLFEKYLKYKIKYLELKSKIKN